MTPGTFLTPESIFALRWKYSVLRREKPGRRRTCGGKLAGTRQKRSERFQMLGHNKKANTCLLIEFEIFNEKLLSLVIGLHE